MCDSPAGGVNYRRTGGEIMAQLVLIDTATGTRIRHRVRGMKDALKQQEWYESSLGRRIRIEKRFKKR
ncbi:hypothetical protein CUJ86_02585 [Methanofollis fontis]|uniref:Uncharacterized protein n=1 Tax=Methanofollis fontis TaxID=2052832 RepID=A0A483CVT2_9EURY|nr:hypothetical protein CUJ86_02585 [Methanofollis fontis]